MESANASKKIDESNRCLCRVVLSHDGLMINLALDKRGLGEVGEVLELSEIVEILLLLCRKYGNLEEALANFPIKDVEPELLNQARAVIADSISCGGLSEQADKEINFYPKDGIK
jgi:hypothetical protein